MGHDNEHPDAKYFDVITTGSKSIAEIAKLLGVSSKTARKRMERLVKDGKAFPIKRKVGAQFVTAYSLEDESGIVKREELQELLAGMNEFALATPPSLERFLEKKTGKGGVVEKK